MKIYLPMGRPRSPSSACSASIDSRCRLAGGPASRDKYDIPESGLIGDWFRADWVDSGVMPIRVVILSKVLF